MQLATLQQLDIPGLRDVEIKDTSIGKVVQLMFDKIENADLARAFFILLPDSPFLEACGIFVMLKLEALLLVN